MTRLEPSRYRDHLHQESARFRAVLTDARPEARVPSCPDWSVADLLWHLTRVQYFWARTMNHRPAAPDPERGWGEPPRPERYADLLTFFDECSGNLQTSLANADPTEAAWSWAQDQTVGFTLRRQAHEALIHRLDAELVTGQVTPLDPALATDGVHEALDVMFGGCPPWGTFTPGELQVRVDLRDTDTQLWVVLGRFTGTDPESGVVHDEDDLQVVDDPGTEPDLVVEGRAEDLDAWLWHRRDDSALDWAGDATAKEILRRILDQPID